MSLEDNMHLFNYVEQFGKLMSLKKHQHLIRQGQEAGSLYFIRSGLIKAYYLTTDGKEFIKSFISEGNVIGSLSTLYEHQPSTFSMVCLEDTMVYEIDFKHLFTTTSDDPELSQIMIRTLIELAQKKEKREYEFLCLTAAERYQLLTNENPELVNRLTQNDIAKYLGITAVGLSRIKSRNQ